MTETTRRTTPLTVGQVADLFGITRRTLHHYDEVELVVPGGRSAAGYRLYTDEDLSRLQHVVVYRRLGFGLQEIAFLLDQPDSVEAHLRRQRATVTSRLDELRGLVTAIDTALEQTMKDTPITTQEMKELFGDGWDESLQAEAEHRWGDSEEWRKSQERTKDFSKADWAGHKAATDELEAAFATALDAGEPADGPVAADLAEGHRAWVGAHYDCDHAMQVRLAKMYVADDRFSAHYDGRRIGLARYVHDAIVANAARHGD